MADAVNRPAPDVEELDDDEMPRLGMSGHRLLVFIAFVGVALAGLYFVLPKLSGLDETWGRIEHGSPFWLIAALGLEVLAFAGYNLIFRTVALRGAGIGWRESLQINLAGLAATRIFAAAGAGGIALTAWALRRAGIEAREVATRMIAVLVCVYSVYMSALVIVGTGMYVGIFPGGSSFALTALPAIFGASVIVIVALLTLVPANFDRRLEGWASSGGRLARIAQRLATVPASISGGVKRALSVLRARDPGLLGAPLYWAADIGVLWACFHAYGEAPPWPVIVMGYYIGMLANTLPLPGGIGGVDGGMIGAFAAFGVDVSLATVAVLTYRGFSFWLPTIPGIYAYLRLRKTVARWRVTRVPVVEAQQA